MTATQDAIAPWIGIFESSSTRLKKALLALSREQEMKVGSESFIQWLLIQGDKDLGSVPKYAIRELDALLLDRKLERIKTVDKDRVERPTYSAKEAKRERELRVFAALLSVDLGNKAVDSVLNGRLMELMELSQEWKGMVALLGRSQLIKDIAKEQRDAKQEKAKKKCVPRITTSDIPIPEAGGVVVCQAFCDKLAVEVFGKDPPAIDAAKTSKTLSTLRARYRDTILLRLGSGLTYRRIGELTRREGKPTGITASRAQSNYQEGLRSLRHSSRSNRMMTEAQYNSWRGGNDA